MNLSFFLIMLGVCGVGCQSPTPHKAESIVGKYTYAEPPSNGPSVHYHKSVPSSSGEKPALGGYVGRSLGHHSCVGMGGFL